MLATGVTTQPTARICSTSKTEVDHANVQHALYDPGACKITLGQNGIRAWYIHTRCVFESLNVEALVWVGEVWYKACMCVCSCAWMHGRLQLQVN